MAAGNFQMYQNGLLNLVNGNIDFLVDTIQMRLLDNAHVPNLAAHDAWDDVSAQECADVDYTPQALASKTLSIVGGKVVFDAADVDFGNAVTISARYAVLLKWTGTPATSYLIGLIDLNDGGSANVSSSASDFDIGFSANGIYRITP